MEELLRKYKDCDEMTFTNAHGPNQKLNVLFETSDIMVGYSELDIGEELKEGKHNFIETIFRLEGTTKHIIEGKEFIVEEGMVLKVPQFNTHSCKVEGNKKVRQLVLVAKNQFYGNFFEN